MAFTHYENHLQGFITKDIKNPLPLLFILYYAQIYTLIQKIPGVRTTRHGGGGLISAVERSPGGENNLL